MLRCHYAAGHFAECNYAERHYVWCHYAEFFIRRIFRLTVISFYCGCIMPRVIMLRFVMPRTVMLGVIMLCHFIECR